MKTYPLYLNGQWEQSGPEWPVVNPATGETFARISTVNGARVEEALRDGHEAFLSWRRLPGRTRGEFLTRVANELERRGAEVARTITLENGKPLAQSVAEVAMTVDHLRWFAEEARRAYGRVVPPQVEGKRHIVIKTPMGPVGAISPWNFPLVLAVRKIAPALAAGCTVILKPARQTPLSAVAFAECIHAAGEDWKARLEIEDSCNSSLRGLRGVFQVVVGPAAEIGETFLKNPLCRKVSFTGSTEVGKSLIRGAAEQVKPLSLELGGHNPVLVFEDADREKAVDGALLAKFRNTGQSCIAANRIYVQRGVYDRFLESFVDKTKAMKIGDGLEEGVQIGPMIDEAAIEKALHHVEDAVRRGARLLCGGRRLDRAGFFFEPAVLADVPDDALAMCEETFAPVAVIARFNDEADGVARANNSVYGLAAYVFTRDLGRTLRLAETLEAGIIGVNDGVPTTTQCPFGGVKQSGWGRELGTEGMEAFLDTKYVSLGV